MRPSHLKRYKVRRNRYEIPIGMGLFTACDIPSGTHIVFFVGEILTNPAEIKHRGAQREPRADNGVDLGKTECVAVVTSCLLAKLSAATSAARLCLYSSVRCFIIFT